MSNDAVTQPAIEAWWLSVLEGGVIQAHPIYVGLRAHVANGVLVITGTVPTTEARGEVVQVARRVCATAVRDIQDKITVRPDDDGQAGLLMQTVIAIFSDGSQADFAMQYIEGRPDVMAESLQLIVQSDANVSWEQAVPEEYRHTVGKALAAGHAVVVSTVDETRAFRLRELLEEETKSIETLVSPPVARSGHRSNATEAAQ